MRGAGTAAGRPAGALFGIEVAKQLRRPRTVVTLAVVAAVAVAVGALVAGTRAEVAERIGDWGSVTPSGSGLALPLVVTDALTLFTFPLAVAVLAGDAVAAEAGWGSLRYLLARPVPRWRVLGSKVVLAGALSVGVVALAIVAALVVGLAADGWHPLAVLDLKDSTPLHLAGAVFSPWGALARTAGAAGVVLASLGSVFAVSVLVSTMTASPFAAVAAGIGVTMASRALDNIPGFRALGPWLPATDAGNTSWTGIFGAPSQLGAVWHLLAVQATYTAVLLGTAFVVFGRSDALD